VGPQRAVIGML